MPSPPPPIPPDFHSDETGEPFDRCIDCGRALRDEGVPYVIEKAIRHFPDLGARDVVFEYAMCWACYQLIVSEFSKESLERITNYFEEHDAVARFMASTHGADDPAPWIERCILTGVARPRLREYQIVAYCRGDRLQAGQPPLLVGGEAIDALASLLSSKTLDVLGGFKDRFTNLPPEFAGHPSGGGFVFL